MPLEIERKFLVDMTKWSPSGDYKLIRQGYISKDVNTTIRVRIVEVDQMNNFASYALMTIKGATVNFTRTEIEFEIPMHQARELLKEMCPPPHLMKRRYEHQYAGKTWEIDVFEDGLEGLVIAEIELQHAREDFDLPPWLGREVSGDPAYFNSSLHKGRVEELMAMRPSWNPSPPSSSPAA